MEQSYFTKEQLELMKAQLEVELDVVVIELA